VTSLYYNNNTLLTVNSFVVSDAEFDQYADALKTANCDLTALAYLKRFVSVFIHQFIP